MTVALIPSRITTKREAEAIAGTLSKPSKMPGHGYGLPARECITGSRLRPVEGSTCHGCYAMRGRYIFGNVQAAQYRRLAAIAHPEWEDAMCFLIDRTGDPYFRWHDSGDIQSVEHLARIDRIAARLPHVVFWLPTREVRIVRDFLATYGELSPNLTVRISAHMVGHVPPRAPLGLPYSTVTRDGGQDVGDCHLCPAATQSNECGDCRACWTPSVSHVSYPIH